MKKQKRISVSFSREFEAEYVYIINLSNSSDFICQAIREKLKGSTESKVKFEEYIKGIVKQVFLDNYPLQVPINAKIINSDLIDDQSLIEAAEHFNF